MRSESMKPWLGVFFLLLLLFMSIAAAYSGSSLAETKPAEQKSTPALPTVGSKAKLLELLKNASGSQPRLYLEKSTAVPAEGSAGRTQDQATSSASNTAAGYSQTNVQVEGVDEADIVKTDGKYIYQINNNRVLIIKAQPSSSLQVISRLTFSDKNFNLEEFYVDSNYLTVIGSSGQEIAVPCKTGQSDAKVFCPPNWRYRHSTQVYIYNISDKNSPKKIRELELEGRYLSSRKIGSDLYLASNQPFYFYNEDEVFLPTYKDSALGNLTTSPGYNDIKYFPDHIYPAYITLAGLKIDQPSVKADIQTCLGQSDNLYASASSLYLAVTDYNQPRSVIGQEIVPSSPGTTVFKFLLNGGKTIYSGKGEVNGTIINQFSMDEYNGCFRIATTSGNMWRNDQYTSKNNIYVLDKDMKLIGKLEGIAPGEQIYSTRFMGKRAYMVTFKKVDPFFVIDMKDPAKPSVLGKLKIPGYSDYLHPYDENHIIGFGKDTIETKGTGQDSWAYYQGMKIALFDVSDVNNPKEMSKQVIGDRGTDSELLHNHKALLFSREKNLLAFPVTVMEIRADDKQKLPDGIPAYGSFAFQGAYIYNIDLKDGFKYRGRISHLASEDYKMAGDSWYDSEKNIERLLYINDDLFTLSQSQIQVHALKDLKKLGSLSLKP